jgi:hypothetical protein
MIEDQKKEYNNNVASYIQETHMNNMGEPPNTGSTEGGRNSIHNMQFENSRDQTTTPITFTNFPLKIFSIIFQYVKWIGSLRWYIIMLIVIFSLFIIFQFEQSIESRRNKKKMEKEGMQNENIKGIIKDVAKNTGLVEEGQSVETPTQINSVKKHVSFENDVLEILPTKIQDSFIGESSNPGLGKSPSSTSSALFTKVTSISETLQKIYNLWILPWLYVLFRNIGL